MHLRAEFDILCGRMVYKTFQGRLDFNHDDVSRAEVLMRRPVFGLVFLALQTLSCWGHSSALSAPAVMVVGDGGDLLGAIAAAADGDVIEIQSNETFSGVSWTDKYLTIRAGNGFHPTVGAIMRLLGDSNTGGEFRGLNIQGPVYITGVGSRSTRLDFVDSVIQSDVTFEGTGDLSISATFRNSRLVNAYMHGTGDLSGNLLIENSELTGGLVVSTISRAHYDLTVRDSVFHSPVSSGSGVTTVIEDSVFHRGFGGGTTFDDTADITLLRSVLHDTLGVAFGNLSSTKVRAENNLIVATEDTSGVSGIRLRANGNASNSTTDISFVNNTVVGFEQGIRVEDLDRNVASNPQLSFANMLLYNTVDVVGLLDGEINSSLIADGTFAGINDNVGGVPDLGSNQQLLAGSIGIDLGNNSAAGPLLTDIAGNSRILDGNGDGMERVDAGAYEFVIPEPCSFQLFTIAAIWYYISRRRFSPVHD